MLCPKTATDLSWFIAFIRFQCLHFPNVFEWAERFRDMFSNQENTRIFSQNKKNMLTKEEFSYPLYKKIWLELRTSQNKNNFLVIRKIFLPNKSISYFKIDIVILRAFLNQDNFYYSDKISCVQNDFLIFSSFNKFLKLKK